jgi:hypothetical protein
MRLKTTAAAALLALAPLAHADDTRQLVELPEMMQGHMLANMRDHLQTLNEVLALLAQDKLEAAADVAESRLGMSSLDKHGASHLAKFMPEPMQELGTNMHRAASQFAIVAQEGSALPAYRALQKVTASCVACHASYRIR